MMDMLKYLNIMHRYEIPCIQVSGYSYKNKEKDLGEYHAWNKVMLDDNWYHMDICWADAGTSKYDLKSDEYYEENGHQVIEKCTGLFKSNFNYK